MEYFAQSADPDVLDVKAYGPETHSQEGRVFLYVLSRSGNGTAPQPLLDKVAASVSDDETRPMTDFVSVRTAEIIPYDVVEDIHIPYGLDGELVMANARKALQLYTDSVHRIGSVASRSGMDGALHQTGVITVIVIACMYARYNNCTSCPVCKFELPTKHCCFFGSDSVV